jgi:hypothetical protein
LKSIIRENKLNDLGLWHKEILIESY